jgi:hypothetical protein
MLFDGLLTKNERTTFSRKYRAFPITINAGWTTQ